MYSTIDSYTHRNWTGEIDGSFDLAMLQLNRDIEVPIPGLDKKGTLEDVDFVAFGPSFDDAEKPVAVQDMMHRLTSAPLEDCQDIFDTELEGHTICAGPVSPKDCLGKSPKMPFFYTITNPDSEQSVLGDIGGPLIVANALRGSLAEGDASLDVIVGVFSAGRQTKDGSYVCDMETPGIHTGVASSSDWISRVVKGKARVRTHTLHLFHGTSSSRIHKERSAELRQLQRSAKPIKISRPTSCSWWAFGYLSLTGLYEVAQEMVSAVERNDPILAEALVLAGVDVKKGLYNSSKDEYPLEKGSNLLHRAAAYDSVQCAEV